MIRGGSVSVDGQDLRDVQAQPDPADGHRSAGQRAVNGTIRENLLGPIRTPRGPDAGALHAATATSSSTRASAPAAWIPTWASGGQALGGRSSASRSREPSCATRGSCSRRSDSASTTSREPGQDALKKLMKGRTTSSSPPPDHDPERGRDFVAGRRPHRRIRHPPPAAGQERRYHKLWKASARRIAPPTRASTLRTKRDWPL